ncbi:MAG: hypothetical protein ACR2RL_22430 [Gammaproteobacteria bacterium]
MLESLPRVQRFAALLWPTFIMAGLASVVFFGVFDPVRVLECTGEAPLNRIGAYSLAFFCFWALCIASSAATIFFLRPKSTIRARSH